MTGRPVKHSLTLRGHRTSVSLEEDFWREFRRIAGRLLEGVEPARYAVRADAIAAEIAAIAICCRPAARTENR